MSDTECPYCEAEVEINHDDGYGYQDGRVYNQECRKCGKTFVYTTSTSFHYEPFKAPCLNGEEHKWKKVNGIPVEYYVKRHRCEYCDETRDIEVKP